MIEINSGGEKVIFTYGKNDFLMNYFSERLQEDLTGAQKDFDKRPGYVQGENNHHLLEEDEKYTTRIFRIQSRLATTSEQLLHIRLYVNRYPFRKHYMSQGISQLEYIQYHMEALYHKVHTIHEIMLLMINEVFSLNLPEMKCRWPNLTKKLDATEKPMKFAHTYFKTFENLIGLRHLNSHRGYYEDEEKDKIDLYYGVFFYKEEAKGLKMNEDLKKMFPPALTRYKLIEFKKQKVELIDLIIKENEKLLHKFLESLLPVYEAQLHQILGHEKQSKLRQLFKQSIKK
ncbi:MAG: Cthe_2314 family HEPN domain-containing protein [Pedobacter sp.]|jgi:hypothetical protein|uniref:Cthe_2314 family HEPN domain-containing protein n=1 Tax=Pedobacter sp. TaxID=1411316 RepID=UPI0035637DC7